MCCHLMTEHIRQTQGSQKHIAVVEYEADSKVTGAHRVNRPLPYGIWRRLYQLRDKEWSDRLGKKVVA